MKLIKYGHACVRLEKEGRAIVIDPGALAPQAEAGETDRLGADIRRLAPGESVEL